VAFPTFLIVYVAENSSKVVMYWHALVGPEMIPGNAGNNLVIANVLLALTLQLFTDATEMFPDMKSVLYVTRMMVSLIPLPPGCEMMVALAGTVQL